MSDKEFDEKKINEQTLAKYQKSYNESAFLSKIKKYGKHIGLELLYKAAQLFFVLQKDEVPHSVKMVIIGALGYLISPFDFIPDITPLIGYTDDAVALAFALIRVHGYIDEDVKDKSKMLLAKIFGQSVYEELH